jgi:hypothetical protein
MCDGPQISGRWTSDLKWEECDIHQPTEDFIVKFSQPYISYLYEERAQKKAPMILCSFLQLYNKRKPVNISLVYFARTDITV